MLNISKVKQKMKVWGSEEIGKVRVWEKNRGGGGEIRKKSRVGGTINWIGVSNVAGNF